MDIRKLEYIITIAEEKNLNKAAEKLFVTQSALSQLLAGLKAEGIPPLFTYRKRELHLTDAGKIYVNSARTILGIEKDARAAINDLAMNHIRSFHIAVSPYISSILYLHVLPELRKKFPHTSIQCSSRESRLTLQALENAETDLAFYLSFYDSSNFLNYTVLRQEELVMVSLPGCFGQKLSFILPEQETNLRRICDQAFSQNNMIPDIYAESNDTSVMLSLALAGECIAVLPRDSVTDPRFEICSFPQPCYFYLVAAHRKNFHPAILNTVIHMVEDFL